MAFTFLGLAMKRDIENGISLDANQRHQQNRRKTDDWFRLLVEAMKEGLCMINRQRQVEYANPALSKMLGYSPEELTEQTVTELPIFDATNAKIAGEHLEMHLNGEFSTYELQLIRKDGVPLIVEISPQPMRDAEGNISGCLAILTDVTGRKRDDQLIRMLSTAIEQSPIGVVISDRHGAIEYVNRRICEQTGYQATEFMGQSPNTPRSGASANKAYRNIWEALSAGCEWRGELQDQKKNGDLYWAREIISCIRDSQNNITHYVGLQEDITEKKHAEIALRKSEEKYSLLVESSLAGIAVIEDGKIVYCNRTFADIFNYPLDEVRGLSLLNLIDSEWRENTMRLLHKRDWNQSAPRGRVVLGVKKSGERVWLKKNWTRVEYLGKKALMVNLMDVTSEKEMEESLIESAAQLQALSEQLLAIQEQERKRIASELHDGIGQMLNALKLGMQRRFPPTHDGHDPETLELLTLAQESIDEVRRVATDLRPAMLDDLGIVPTVRWLCRRMQMFVEQIDIKTELSVTEHDVPDSLKTVIFRVLQEALNNATKHAGPCLIKVSLTAHANGLELRIHDDGNGFDPEHPGFRDRNDRGLGLLSMRERVRLSGGTFQLTSAPRQGTQVVANWLIQGAGRALAV